MTLNTTFSVPRKKLQPQIDLWPQPLAVMNAGGNQDYFTQFFKLDHSLVSVPGKFFGIVGEDPSDSKSNPLHVDIFRFCFHSFEVLSMDSSKLFGNSPEVSNFNRLFLKLNRFICN